MGASARSRTRLEIAQRRRQPTGCDRRRRARMAQGRVEGVGASCAQAGAARKSATPSSTNRERPQSLSTDDVRTRRGCGRVCTQSDAARKSASPSATNRVQPQTPSTDDTRMRRGRGRVCVKAGARRGCSHVSAKSDAVRKTGVLAGGVAQEPCGPIGDRSLDGLCRNRHDATTFGLAIFPDRNWANKLIEYVLLFWPASRVRRVWRLRRWRKWRCINGKILRIVVQSCNLVGFGQTQLRGVRCSTLAEAIRNDCPPACACWSC